ncbi:MAG: hypothetical protein KAU94_11895 [Verrucomicrobia bacterium]|nr:hypothetical protein [Verrucomicrobiota bacterium]
MKKRLYIWIAVELLVVLVLPAPAVKKKVDVYILGGQSNMQGIAKIKNLPAGYAKTKAIPHAFFWNGSAFEPFVPGKTKTSARVGEFGPELGFALAMATADRPVYLIKYHASGQPLHHGWNGNRWVGGDPVPGHRNFYPGEKPGDGNQGSLYAKMRERFRAGIGALEDQGHTPVVRGFLWMQGEQDSKNEVSATAYATSLKRLHRRIAEDLDLEEPIPMVFGQVLPHEPPLARFTHRDKIRNQMAAADAASGRPEAIDRVKMVSTDGFGMLPDTVHYNAAGQLRLGQEFAGAIKQLCARE